MTVSDLEVNKESDCTLPVTESLSINFDTFYDFITNSESTVEW
jgi:hypothetical protein